MRNEELPQKLEQLESLKPKMEDLTADERELLAGYLIRKTFTAGMAGKDVELPAGVTIGQAIEEQRSAIEEQKAEQARQAVLQKEMKQKLEEKKADAAEQNRQRKTTQQEMPDKKKKLQQEM